MKSPLNVQYTADVDIYFKSRTNELPLFIHTFLFQMWPVVVHSLPLSGGRDSARWKYVLLSRLHFPAMWAWYLQERERGAAAPGPRVIINQSLVLKGNPTTTIESLLSVLSPTII